MRQEANSMTTKENLSVIPCTRTGYDMIIGIDGTVIIADVDHKDPAMIVPPKYELFGIFPYVNTPDPLGPFPWTPITIMEGQQTCGSYDQPSSKQQFAVIYNVNPVPIPPQGIIITIYNVDGIHIAAVCYLEYYVLRVYIGTWSAQVTKAYKQKDSSHPYNIMARKVVGNDGWIITVAERCAEIIQEIKPDFNVDRITALGRIKLHPDT